MSLILGPAVEFCEHGERMDEACCPCCRTISEAKKYTATQARDILLSMSMQLGMAKQLQRMADSQGQHEITDSIVQSLERAVLSAAELYYELTTKETK